MIWGSDLFQDYSGRTRGVRLYPDIAKADKNRTTFGRFFIPMPAKTLRRSEQSAEPQFRKQAIAQGNSIAGSDHPARGLGRRRGKTGGRKRWRRRFTWLPG
jgi:hypothetical protein